MLTLMALIACTSTSTTPDGSPWLGAWTYPSDTLPELSCMGRPAEDWGIGVGTWEGTLTVEEQDGKLKATTEIVSYVCTTTHAIPEEAGGPAPLDPTGQDCAMVDDPGTLSLTWSEATLTPIAEGGMRHKAAGTLDVFGTPCEISVDVELTDIIEPVDTGDTGDTGTPGDDTGTPGDSGAPEKGSR
jgi:hypothetical protein